MEIDLEIYFTCDVHSNIYNSKEIFEHLLYLKSQKDCVIVDAGDFLEGSPFFNYYNGIPELYLLDTIYDIAVPGNHGFLEFSACSLVNTTKLNCNIILPNGDYAFQPYLTLRKKSNSYFFTGIMSQEAFSCIDYNVRKNFLIDDPLAALKKILLVAKPSDYIILISHSGIDYDSKLAMALTGLNLIISSHCHSGLYQMEIHKTLIVKSFELGKGIGKVTIGKDNRQFTNISSESIPYFQRTPILRINEYVEQFISNNSQLIAVVDDFFIERYNTRELLCEFFITRICNLLECDWGLLNSTSLRDVFHRTDVSIIDLNEVLPFENSVYTFVMNKKIVDQVLTTIDNNLGIVKIVVKSRKKILVTTSSFLYNNYFKLMPHDKLTDHGLLTSLILKIFMNDTNSKKNRRGGC